MGKSKDQDDPVGRCQQLVERTITHLSSDNGVSVITVVGHSWSEELTSKKAGVSLWAKPNSSTPKKVDMKDGGFIAFCQALARKGPGEVDTYDGVEYKFQVYSAFDL